ncbi:putative RDD family membrane protein YckC [Prauserella rugosa]|uniref:Putative RDD family membrane protein YckC n=2 Tax=Prauserella rugosa TaxID=43354 RepID=A0A660C8V2_9PSEU|nr:putative RDD family membrane protein YckC [Prauserella rugosa]
MPQQAGYGGGPGYGMPMPPRKPGEATVLVPGARIQFDGGAPLELASLMYRFLARLLDIVMVGAVVSAVLLPLAIIFGRDSGVFGTSATITSGYAVLYPLIMMIYEAIGLGKRGRTFGKKIMGLRVVTRSSSAHGSGLGAGPAMSRALLVPGLGVLNILLYLGSAALLLYFLSPVFDPRGRRGWHDLVAKTYVISTKPAF